MQRSLRFVLGLFAGLGAVACARNVDGPEPEKAPLPAQARQAPAKPAPTPPQPMPSDPTVKRMAQLDRLLFAWDQAQGAGQTTQADALAVRVRQEVDLGYGEVRAAFDGAQGDEGRYLATMALGFSSRPDSTALLVAGLDSKDPRLVANTLTALALRRDPSTPLVPVGRFLAAQQTDVRRAAPLAFAHVLEARRAAGIAPDPALESQALAHLKGMLRDRDGIIRLHAARATGELRVAGAAPALIPLLRDTHERVRLGAASALAKRGDREGMVEVVRMLNEASVPEKADVAAVLTVYAQTLSGGPLPEAQRQQLGTNAMGWLRWYADWEKTHPLAPAGPAPRSAPAGAPAASPAPPQPPAVPTGSTAPGR